MQTKGGASGHAKADRNARHKRLNIRRMVKSNGGAKRPLHSGQAVAGGDEKRNTLDYVDVPVSTEGTEHSTHEKKLKGLVGCSNFDSSECSDLSCHEQTRGDVTLREASDRGEGSKSIARLSCGSISVMGRRRVMEDALTVAPRILAGEYEFFAAYDGHGGTRVAYACRDQLHHLLEKELEGKWRDLPGDNKPSTSGGKDGIDWTKVLEECFSKMDEEVQINRVGVEEEVGNASVAAATAESGVGSTAVVALVGTEELVVANCGDSRAVLCRGGVALPLSNDHKVSRMSNGVP